MGVQAQETASSAPILLHAQVQHADLATNNPSSIPILPEHGGIIGLDLLIKKGSYPWIQEVLPDSPAKNEGVLPGDCLVGVNGISTMNKNPEQVDVIISDRPGDRVILSLLREGHFLTVDLIVAKPESLQPEFQAWFQQH